MDNFSLVVIPVFISNLTFVDKSIFFCGYVEITRVGHYEKQKLTKKEIGSKCSDSMQALLQQNQITCQKFTSAFTNVKFKINPIVTNAPKLSIAYSKSLFFKSLGINALVIKFSYL